MIHKARLCHMITHNIMITVVEMWTDGWDTLYAIAHFYFLPKLFPKHTPFPCFKLDSAGVFLLVCMCSEY